MRSITVTAFHPRAQDLVGYIPSFLTDAQEGESAKEVFQRTYAHGGGWRPMTKAFMGQKNEGWRMQPRDHSIKYPGDPVYAPVARIEFNDERIYIYEHAWVAIVQPTGEFEIARMD